jgi:poly-gamma-glutamate synthesis protein (capsule biosynthesis protein)
VYREKPIIYGCGDFLNDYEGISGYEAFRDDLALMSFVTMDPWTGTLRRLQMAPMQIKRFRAHRVTITDAQWLRDTLHREGGKLGTRVEWQEDNTLTLRWS